jgi:ubiquinone/menaquinone biosynthesis C-methylase UbiE
MEYVEFLTQNHTKTKRDYVGRVNEFPKAKAMEKACLFEEDYWDGERYYGYGGYKYDGRWKKVAEDLASHYNLKKGDKVLDIGCGKGFLLYELTQVVPGIEVQGIDISHYAIKHAKEEVKPFVIQGDASHLPFQDKTFDFVISLNTLHNLPCEQLEKALKEMQRVSKGKAYLCVESFRDNEEKVNMLYWQITCQSFYSPESWKWWFKHCEYTGDYGFIYFT